MITTQPTSDMTVAEILERWPETATVFQEYKTACVGCVMAPFDSMVDVAQTYEIELDQIMRSLHQAIRPAGINDGRNVDNTEAG